MEKGEIQSKKGLYSIISLIILVFIVIGSYFFLLPSNPGVKHLNLKYGNSQKQALDLYSPKVQNEKRLPVIIYVHGGGWSGGDKGNVDEKPAFFVNKGYVFVSVEHRFSPQVSYEQ